MLQTVIIWARLENPRCSSFMLLARFCSANVSLPLGVLNKSDTICAVGWGEKPEEDAKDLRPKAPKTDKLSDHLSQYHRRPSKVDPNVSYPYRYLDAL